MSTVGIHARKSTRNGVLAAFTAGAVALSPMTPVSSASSPGGATRAFTIDCGPGRSGPALRVAREVRSDGAHATVTLSLANRGPVAVKGARFAEDLSEASDGLIVGRPRATAGRLSYSSPRLSWTGDLAAGHDATIRYAVPARPGRAVIRTVDTDAGTTCRPIAAGPASAQRKASPARPKAGQPVERLRPASAARKAPLPFAQRYLNNFRGGVTRAANTVLTCYPPAVPDCSTRQNGSGNNSVASTYVDVDSDATTFNSSTASLQTSAGAKVAYARLYWGGRSQTTTDTPGLPAGNRLSPNIALRGQVLIKAPGSSTYQTVTAAAGDIGDTPDGTTTAGIVYGASADVTSLVANAGAGTYAVGNIQSGRGFDGLGAFGGWTLVVAYRDPTLPLRNISVFDGFLQQAAGTPDTTVTLSGFQTPSTGAVNVQLGQVALDGDNAITGDSQLVKSTNGPLTVLSDALHPADNFFNSTIANLGSQVTARNPTYTNTLGYDSNIVDASSAFRNSDTSAQFTFRTTGDSYWPQAFFTQTDLHQANVQLTKTAQVVGGGTPTPGSVVQYTVTATNNGDDNAINVVLSDPIPANTTYVPGTIVVASGPNAGPKTDPPGDDQGEIVANQIGAQLGTGATAFAGGRLSPGQSTSVTFRVTLGEGSAGTSVTNTATVNYASADTPTDTGTATASASVIVPASVTSLSLLKTASPGSVARAGRVITYSFQITNTGNRPLTNVNVADTAFSGTGPPPAISCPVTSLAAGASTTCTGTYTVTQADIDAGAITNTAVATGTAPSGAGVTSMPSSTTVTTTAVSGLALLKTATPSTVSAAGQTVTYRYQITNTGNTTLTSVGAADTAFSGTGTRGVILCPVTTLAPQATTTCTATYTVTQADVDAGTITNTAVASGRSPSGPVVTSDPSTATVTATMSPSLALLKTANPTTVGGAGRTVLYSFVVTNTGNTTLTNVSVTDTAFSGTGPPPVISCPVTALAPQQSTTCTAAYVVTQADVDAGSITNTGAATGTPPTGPAVTSNTSTATVTAASQPSLALLKTASPSTVTAAGQTVTYQFQVTNTGNRTLTGVSVADTAFTGRGAPLVIMCPVTTLAPQASTTCTATYTVTQADADAGTVINTATASGTPPTGPAVTSNPSTVTVTVSAQPSLALLKTASPSTVTTAGRVITYSFQVMNTGNTTLTGVSATDTSFSGTGPPPVISCPLTTLAPQQSTTCTGTYTMTQADIDAGGVTDTATASGTPPTGPAVTSAPSTATVTALAGPGLALLKTAAPSAVTAAGQTVTYSYLLTNTGNTTLTGVTAADTAFSGTGTPPVVTCPLTTLAPHQSTTCTGTYTVTQADIDAGGVTNTATASGTPPTGPAVISNPSTATVTAATAPSVALSKTASPSSVTAAGQPVTYRYLVINTGNTTLTGVTATDTAFSGTGTPPVVTCPLTTLAPQQSTTCTGTYTVTQADIDAGGVTNTATASGSPPTGPAVTSDPSTATVTTTPGPAIGLLKTAAPATVASAGQTITYSYRVSNIGNTTLTGVTATDTAFSGTGTPPVVTCPVTTLAPEMSTTCTGTYTVTQADVDAGGLTNTATASGTPPTGPAVTSDPSTATVTAASSPGLALLKTANPSIVARSGRTITYSFVVTNTGNTTLTGVTVADTSFSGTGTPPVVTCPVTTLVPQASTTCTATYVVTQGDVDAGSVVDTAIATGTPPTGPDVTSNASTATVTATPVVSLALLKTATPSTVTAAGQTVTYAYQVTNTGNITLNGVSAADTASSGTGTPPVVTCPVTTLAPQATTTCTGTYTVTQADVDAGSVVDTATATGTPPTGPAVTSDPSTATVTATPLPSLSLLKTADTSTVTSAGRTIIYAYQVTNTGNTGLAGIGVTDTSFSGSGTPSAISCPVTALAPQQSTTCTGSYTVTQADVDSGSVVDTAVATGTPPVGPAVTSDPSTATVTAAPAPSLALLKTASPSTVTAAGQTITYSFQVTNTGNSTLTGVSAADTAFSGTGPPPVVTCPVTTLAPQASTTCTGTYTVTQADIDAGSITDTAIASGTPPTGPAVNSDPSTATVSASTLPSLALLKTAGPSMVTAAGRTVTYSFQIANTGNTTLTGVGVTETAFSGSGAPPVITCPVTTLAPQASTTCTGTYTVTQADVDAGSVTNTAVANGTPPTGPAVTSSPSTATVTAVAAPGLALLKTVTPAVSEAGQPVAYTYRATNTGNTTLTGLSITDTAFSGTGTPSPIMCPVTTLAPGASTTCTATYTVTQADVDAGSVVNTATASGNPPTGPPVTSNASTATVLAASVLSLSLAKTAAPATVTSAGQTVTYSFLVANTGNTTLTGVGAADTAFSGTGTPPTITCPVTTLGPGGSTTCTGVYTVTQTDVDAGAITNTGTAFGTPPTGPAVTAPPSTATVTAAPAPALSLLKTTSPTAVTAAGQTVTYSFSVANTGNTTLTGVSVAETSFSGTGTPPVVTCPATALVPQQSTTCTGTYTVTQADADAGSITNTATASGTPPTGPPITSNESTATVTVTRISSLALSKTATPATVTAAGQIVTYSFTVTNTGNTSLTGLSAADTAFSGTGTPPVISCPVTTLAPQASTVCTGTYTVTQADIDAGSITNTGSVSGTAPTGETVTSAPSMATVTTTLGPAVTMTKSASPTTVTAAGQTVTYSFLVANTGNTTLTGVSITETAFSGTGTPPVISCPVTTLAPGASTTCTGTYTVTQADIDAGSVTDTATASGTPPSGPPVTSAPSSATVTATTVPSLALLKTASPSSVSAAGQTVTYSFQVTNTGNATLTDLGVTETSFSGTGARPVVTCPATTLAPGASTTCTGTYTVTQGDIDAGSIADTAIASGTPPTGPVVTSDPSSATVTAAAAPSLMLLKTASPSSVSAAGQTVTYSFQVTNTGNSTLTGVSVTETAFSGTGTPPVITCPLTRLAPGASTTCTGTYVVTQADVDAGSVTDTATASGLPPTGPAVTSDPSSATVTAAAAPSLMLLKTASPSSVSAAGQTVTYSFQVTNTGNSTLTGVNVTETAFSGTGTPPVITCPVMTLAPGASTTCTGTYVVTQADVDAGSITRHRDGFGHSADGSGGHVRPVVGDGHRDRCSVAGVAEDGFTVVGDGRGPDGDVLLPGHQYREQHADRRGRDRDGVLRYGYAAGHRLSGDDARAAGVDDLHGYLRGDAGGRGRGFDYRHRDGVGHSADGSGGHVRPVVGDGDRDRCSVAGRVEDGFAVVGVGGGPDGDVLVPGDQHGQRDADRRERDRDGVLRYGYAAGDHVPGDDAGTAGVHDLHGHLHRDPDRHRRRFGHGHGDGVGHSADRPGDHVRPVVRDRRPRPLLRRWRVLKTANPSAVSAAGQTVTYSFQVTNTGQRHADRRGRDRDGVLRYGYAAGDHVPGDDAGAGGVDDVYGHLRGDPGRHRLRFDHRHRDGVGHAADRPGGDLRPVVRDR